MNDEWGLPISKNKIISRRNRLIEYQKVSELRFTPLYEAIDENILDINYMIYEIERLQKQLEAYENMRKEAIKYVEEHIIYETDDCINGMHFCSYHLYDFSKEDLLNILNKVGGSDE